MREKISVDFRVKMLPTEAVVFGHRLVVFKIALRAFPVENVKWLFELLLVDIFDPFFYALQVHGDVAASAGPYPVFPPDLLWANDAV